MKHRGFFERMLFHSSFNSFHTSINVFLHHDSYSTSNCSDIDFSLFSKALVLCNITVDHPDRNELNFDMAFLSISIHLYLPSISLRNLKQHLCKCTVFQHNFLEISHKQYNHSISQCFSQEKYVNRN